MIQECIFYFLSNYFMIYICTYCTNHLIDGTNLGQKVTFKNFGFREMGSTCLYLQFGSS